MTIVEFLNARLDEQEKAAREATEGPWRYWLAEDTQANGHQFGIVEAGYIEGDWTGFTNAIAAGYTTDPGDVGQQFDASQLEPANARHIAANNPSAVLADVAAKRAIVERYVDTEEWGKAGHYDEYASEAEGLKTALILLASPYADHPDYNPEWKP